MHAVENHYTASIADELMRELRNGLAAVHGEILDVRNAVEVGQDREILTAALHSLDGLADRLRELCVEMQTKHEP